MKDAKIMLSFYITIKFSFEIRKINENKKEELFFL